jgi:hypothetical protein
MISELPRAWLGYAADGKSFCVVKVCAWCPDKAQADKLAGESGLTVTHTICPACYARRISAIMPASD